MTGGCLQQRLSVVFSFGNWQAVVVWVESFVEQGIAVDEQVVGCDGGGGMLVGSADIVYCFRSSNMLKDDA